MPLQGKHRVLTTGLPGKSPKIIKIFGELDLKFKTSNLNNIKKVIVKPQIRGKNYNSYMTKDFYPERTLAIP